MPGHFRAMPPIAQAGYKANIPVQKPKPRLSFPAVIWCQQQRGTMELMEVFDEEDSGSHRLDLIRAGDRRAAVLLANAHSALEQTAASIPDPTVRQSYLTTSPNTATSPLRGRRIRRRLHAGSDRLDRNDCERPPCQVPCVCSGSGTVACPPAMNRGSTIDAAPARLDGCCTSFIGRSVESRQRRQSAKCGPTPASPKTVVQRRYWPGAVMRR